jgi:hypothetical protein
LAQGQEDEMLLSLWSDFWPANYGPWPPGNGPVIITQQDMGSGGGKDKYFPQVPAIPDSRATDSYWEAREEFLRRHLPAVETEEEPAPEIETVVARKRVILEDVLQARVTTAQMIDLDHEMHGLQEKLLLHDQMMEDEALELLLLA